MKLDLNLKNDEQFKKSLENTFAEAPNVGSGMYQCVINLALLKTKNKQSGVEQCIAVTFDALENGKKIGQFNYDFTLDTKSDFYRNTFALFCLTGHLESIEDAPWKRQDGTVIMNGRNEEMRHFPTLEGKKMVAGVIRKDDYTASNGTVYANYSLYYLYNENKQNAKEAWENLPPNQIKADYARLTKQIEKDRAQKEALNNQYGENSMPSPQQSFYSAPQASKPQVTSNPQVEEPNPIKTEYDVPF